MARALITPARMARTDMYRLQLNVSKEVMAYEYNALDDFLPRKAMSASMSGRTT